MIQCPHGVDIEHFQCINCGADAIPLRTSAPSSSAPLPADVRTDWEFARDEFASCGGACNPPPHTGEWCDECVIVNAGDALARDLAAERERREAAERELDKFRSAFDGAVADARSGCACGR